MDTKAERDRLREQIRKAADPDFQEVMDRVIPTRLKIYGLRMPPLRGIVRSWKRAHAHVKRRELLELVEELWAGESREERMLALELLQSYPRWIPSLAWSRFERWRGDLDNWELTDSLGAAVLGRWVLDDVGVRSKHLWDLISDGDVWSRRLALVSTVGMNRASETISFPVLTLELIDQIKEERHPMVTKATSWALRVLLKKHREQVSQYLESNSETLARHIVREVSSKLETGVKYKKVKQ